MQGQSKKQCVRGVVRNRQGCQEDRYSLGDDAGVCEEENVDITRQEGGRCGEDTSRRAGWWLVRCEERDGWGGIPLQVNRLLLVSGSERKRHGSLECGQGFGFRAGPSSHACTGMQVYAGHLSIDTVIQRYP